MLWNKSKSGGSRGMKDIVPVKSKGIEAENWSRGCDGVDSKWRDASGVGGYAVVAELDCGDVSSFERQYAG